MPQHPNKPDSDRLTVRYDVARKLVTITCQGQVHVLPDTYATFDDGMIAGYGFARAQGWHS
jgi:hypothetical protein